MNAKSLPSFKASRIAYCLPSKCEETRRISPSPCSRMVWISSPATNFASFATTIDFGCGYPSPGLRSVANRLSNAKACVVAKSRRTRIFLIASTLNHVAAPCHVQLWHAAKTAGEADVRPRGAYLDVAANGDAATVAAILRDLADEGFAVSRDQRAPIVQASGHRLRVRLHHRPTLRALTRGSVIRRPIFDKLLPVAAAEAA